MTQFAQGKKPHLNARLWVKPQRKARGHTGIPLLLFVERCEYIVQITHELHAAQ